MRHEIRSELVATIASVVTAPGAPVHEGEMLFLLESMKMEIPVLAEVDGSVVDMRVVVGQVVQSGDVLGVLETSPVPRTG